MTNEHIIKQLESLIDDREALCISDPEHDESYIKDIDALKAAIEFLKNAKTVKHGRWIKHSIDDPKSLLYGAVKDTTCSVCNRSTPYTTEYCMHCGARMDGDTK